MLPVKTHGNGARRLGEPPLEAGVIPTKAENKNLVLLNLSCHISAVLEHNAKGEVIIRINI